jgi:pyruvate dehydrogenase E1 component alpha subunit
MEKPGEQAISRNGLEGFDKETLLRFYHDMLLIRRFEEKVAEEYTRANIGGFVHLNIGEEAAIVGSITSLAPEDYLFSSYRDHGIAVERGAGAGAVMAELYGKVEGTSKGRGGSMHLFDLQHRFLGGYAIVGGFLPIAVGAGLSIQYRGDKEIVMAIFGDGATNIGTFHEALNIAQLWSLPVLFIIVNNQYGMGTQVSRASAVTELWRKGCAYGLPGERVDGMDVVAVRRAVDKAASTVRSERKPVLIEEVAYRYRGHSMSDPARYRSEEEVQSWKQRDPIENLAQRLTNAGVSSQEELEQVEQGVEQEVQNAVEFAESGSFPEASTLRNYVYAGREDH